ncbi:unnamed protein product [Lota lota]
MAEWSNRFTAGWVGGATEEPMRAQETKMRLSCKRYPQQQTHLNGRSPGPEDSSPPVRLHSSLLVAADKVLLMSVSRPEPVRSEDGVWWLNRTHSEEIITQKVCLWSQSGSNGAISDLISLRADAVWRGLITVVTGFAGPDRTGGKE